MGFVFEEQGLKGVFLITPKVFKDNRGYFLESYKKADFEAAGITADFLQDNESSSTKGVLRGLHFQTKHTQGKLVRVTNGRIYDVVVDVRPGSDTFGKYLGFMLDSEKKQMLYVPPGFAHGFLVLSDTASFVYKCTDVYDPSAEGGILWNDPDIGVEWPKLDCEYITSDKDGRHPGFNEQSFEWAAKFL